MIELEVGRANQCNLSRPMCERSSCWKDSLHTNHSDTLVIVQFPRFRNSAITTRFRSQVNDDRALLHSGDHL
jgi:hypothetical protein